MTRVIILLLPVGLAGCLRHPLVNPVDPFGDSYIGYDSLDRDGDGVGGWEDVDEIDLEAPDISAVLGSTTPTLVVRLFNPDVVSKYWIEIATDSTFSPESTIYSNDAFSSNECAIPEGYLKNQQNYHWRAKAYGGEKWSDEWSEPRTFFVYIELAPPEGISPVSLQNIQVRDAVTLHWEESADAIAYHVQCSDDPGFEGAMIIDDDSLSQTTLSLNSELQSRRSYYWRVRIQNDDGVWGQWGEIYSFSVTSGLPDAENKSPPNGAVIVNTTPVLSWDITAEAGEFAIELAESSNFVDSTKITGLSQPQVNIVSPLEPKTYYWRVISKSAAGIWGSPGPAWLFTIDVSPAALLSPSDGAYIPGAQSTLAWRAHPGADRYVIAVDDNVDFSSEVLRNDSIVEATFSDLETLEDGYTYYWRVAPMDQTGAIGSFSEPRSFIIDDTAPAAPEVSGKLYTNSSTPVWSWYPPAGAVDLRYQLNGMLQESWNRVGGVGVFTYMPTTPLSEGSHTLYVQAMDAAGNWSESGLHTTIVDTTPPVAPDVSGEEYSGSARPLWTWVTSSDSANGRYRLDTSDPNAWITLGTSDVGSYVPPYDLGEGNHTLEVQLGDAAGNWSDTGSHTVVVDLTPPGSPTVTGPALTKEPRPTWTFLSEEAHRFRYQLDRESNNGWMVADGSTSEYKPQSDLVSGNYTLYVQASDAAGNWSQSGYHTLEVDVDSPAIPVLAVPSLTNNATPSWTWSAPVGIEAIRYQVDGEAQGEWTYDQPERTSYVSAVDLTDGEHTLYVQVQDRAGNWSPSGSATTTIDTVAPTTLILDGMATTWRARPTWTLSGISAEASVIRYRLGGGPWTVSTEVGLMTYISDVSLSQGTHTLYVQVADAAGNWSDTAEFSTVIDSGSIRLLWDPHVDPAVSGYYVYWGTESGIYSNVVEIIGADPLPEYAVSDLQIGQTYYLAVTAYDDNGLESEYSDEVVYRPGQDF